MTESVSTNPRKKAAAARAQQLAKEKRRERTVKLIGGIVVLLVVVAIIGGAWWFSRKSSGPSGPDAAAASPKGVNTTTYAYPVNNAAPPTAPVVQAWEDFQCPGCKGFEEKYGSTLYPAALKGDINLQLRPTTFLDGASGHSKSASALATAAWGCAIDAGKALEYHSAVYALPQSSPTNFTPDQLIGVAEQVGITGGALDTFRSCLTSSPPMYAGWAANSQAQFEADGISGTPTLIVNGKDLDLAKVTTPESLLAAIQAAPKS